MDSPLWANKMELRPLSLRLARGTAVRNTHRRGAPGGGQEASAGHPSSFAVCRGCPGRGLAARGPQPWLSGAAAQAEANIPGTGRAERGRLLEGLRSRYPEARQLPLSEQAGSRTMRGVRAASGFLHENDAVFAFPGFTSHAELKHLSGELQKNELLIFNQKGI